MVAGLVAAVLTIGLVGCGSGPLTTGKVTDWLDDEFPDLTWDVSCSTWKGEWFTEEDRCYVTFEWDFSRPVPDLFLTEAEISERIQEKGPPAYRMYGEGGLWISPTPPPAERRPGKDVRLKCDRNDGRLMMEFTSFSEPEGLRAVAEIARNLNCKAVFVNPNSRLIG